jgi:hypothetical protein
VKLFQTRADLLIAKYREIYREENSKNKRYMKNNNNNNNNKTTTMTRRVKRVGKNKTRKVERLLERGKGVPSQDNYQSS